MNAPVVKHALVCNTVDLPRAYLDAVGPIVVKPIPQSFWQVESRLADRAVCETDEATQQLLPYITLFDEKKRIFVYSRGKGGAEARLVGNLSIGLGGHVDEPVPAGYSLEDWLVSEGERELLEEAGVETDSSIKFTGLIRDTSNPVGRVHIGVWAMTEVDSGDIGDLEAEIIEQGQWLGIATVMKPEIYDRLENWSKAAVIYIYDNGLPEDGFGAEYDME